MHPTEPSGGGDRPRRRRPVRDSAGHDFWKGLLGPGVTWGRSTEIDTWDPTPVVRDAEGGPPRRPGGAVRHRRRHRGARPGRETLGIDPGRFGTIFATGVGGLHTLEEQVITRLEKGAAGSRRSSSR